MCCGYGEGQYVVTLDGQTMASGGDFESRQGAIFACAPGETCNDAIPLTSADYGTVTSPSSSFWYTFTPEGNGMYSFSSCGNGCDTRLYIYDYCQMGNFDDTNEGSIYFDDNQGGCGEEAQLTVLLEAGVTYWVRWASFDGPCTCPGLGVGNLTLSDHRPGAQTRATTAPCMNSTTARACILVTLSATAQI